MHGWCKVRHIGTWLVQGINFVKWLVQGKKLCDMAVKRFLQLSFRIFLFTRNTVESGQYEHSITIQLQYTVQLNRDLLRWRIKAMTAQVVYIV